MKNIFALIILLASAYSSFANAQALEPRFPGCDDASDYDCADMKMLQFIFSNLKVPDAAKSAGITGIVVAKFVVAKDGSLKSPGIKSGLGSGCDEEVLRLLSLMPKWLPGTDEGGGAIDTEWEIEVKFK